MSNTDLQPPQTPERLDKLVLLLGIVVVIGMLGSLGSPHLQHLVFGWVPFLQNGLQGSSFHAATILLAVSSGAGFVVGVYWFLNWLHTARAVQTNDPRPVRSRWKLTFSLTLLSLLMFVSGIAVVGFIHQIAWLATAPANPPEQVGIQASREGLHGWMTPILLYMWYDPGNMKFDEPWNSEANRPYSQSPIIQYWNPSIPKTYDPEGYALSHFSANVHVLSPHHEMTLKHITDGSSHTLMAGGVNNRFSPWAAPGNFRDPARGINKFPDGFGGPAGMHGAYMLMADGSVRIVDDNIDPSVLRALSTPAAGDDASDFK